jgi:hypothetical protein
MKSILYNFALFLIFTSLLFVSQGQIPTVYTRGGENNVNWEAREKQLSDENPFLFGSGCTESPEKARASSFLNQQGNVTYFATKAIDDNPRTAWVEGKSDYGIGQYIEMDLPYGGYNIGFFNGYQKNIESWKNNSRVKKMKVYGDGIPLCLVVMQDKMGCQFFDIPSKAEYTWYRFEIVEVYQGLKWKDVAISEICSYGCCFNANTEIFTNKSEIFASNLMIGSVINSLDIQNNQITASSIVRIDKVYHRQLIRISTDRNSIELTPYHPLYLESFGLTSLYKLKKSNLYESYDDMIQNINVLVWNNDLKECEYIPITNIEVIEGDFETYSIEKLDIGRNYIINDLIKSIYVN